MLSTQHVQSLLDKKYTMIFHDNNTSGSSQNTAESFVKQFNDIFQEISEFTHAMRGDGFILDGTVIITVEDWDESAGDTAIVVFRIDDGKHIYYFRSVADIDSAGRYKYVPEDNLVEVFPKQVAVVKFFTGEELESQ